MASSNPQQTSASGPPPKPWERAGGSSGGAPFKPPSGGSTSDVVEASGTARPGEIVSTADRNNNTVNTNSLGRPVPSRPWEQNYGSSTVGGYGSNSLGYNSGYGSGMYSGGLGGGSYGGGMYGNSMYRGGGYGGGMYGSSGGLYGGGGMYGSGGYGGGQMGGYGMGMGMGGGMGMGMGMGMGGPYGPQDPNDPYGAPSSPPGFWISVMRVMQGVVNFFGRISILIDQNTQAFHLFMTALLQLFDRSGMLYGELARFAMRLLGIKSKPRKTNHPIGPDGLPLAGPHHQGLIEGPGQKAAPGPTAGGSWDNVWGN